MFTSVEFQACWCLTLMQGNMSQHLDTCTQSYILHQFMNSVVNNFWVKQFYCILKSGKNTLPLLLLMLFVNTLIIVCVSACEIPWFTVLLFLCLLFCPESVLQWTSFFPLRQAKVWFWRFVPGTVPNRKHGCCFAVPSSLCHPNRALPCVLPHAICKAKNRLGFFHRKIPLLQLW